MSTECGTSKGAPNAAAAVQIFMDLSTEYLNLVPADETVVVRMNHVTGEARRDLRDALFAFMLGRKFITPGEVVYVPRVVEMVLAEHRQSIGPARRSEIEGWKHEVSKTVRQGLANNGGVVARIDLEGGSIDLQDYCDGILNGRLLHSDFPKWTTIGLEPYFAATTALLHMRTSLRYILLDMQAGLIELNDEHSIFGDALCVADELVSGI